MPNRVSVDESAEQDLQVKVRSLWQYPRCEPEVAARTGSDGEWPHGCGHVGDLPCPHPKHRDDETHAVSRHLPACSDRQLRCYPRQHRPSGKAAVKEILDSSCRHLSRHGAT